MELTIKSPYQFLYKIYYYYDILKNFRLQSYEKNDINKYEKNYIKNIITFKGFINYIVDVVKEYVLRKFKDVSKIKINVEHFDENNKLHSFIEMFHNKINDKKNIEGSVKKSVFIVVYDENDKIYFVGTILY